MKIIHRARRHGKTTDIITAAFENQPSVIVVSNLGSKKLIRDIIEWQCEDFENPPKIDVVLFKDLPEYLIGRHGRKIYIDDLDDCLRAYAGKEINVSSINYDKPCWENRIVKECDELRCPGVIRFPITRLPMECQCCPYQYKHPFDKYWTDRPEEDPYAKWFDK